MPDQVRAGHTPSSVTLKLSPSTFTFTPVECFVFNYKQAVQATRRGKEPCQESDPKWSVRRRMGAENLAVEHNLTPPMPLKASLVYMVVHFSRAGPEPALILYHRSISLHHVPTHSANIHVDGQIWTTKREDEAFRPRSITYFRLPKDYPTADIPE